MIGDRKNIKLLTNILIITVLIIGTPNTGLSQHAFSIGGKKWGVAFGNPIKYSGIRLNLIDFKKGDILNGLNFSLVSSTKKTNGISISLFSNNHDPITLLPPEKRIGSSNGIKIAFINKNGQHTGFQFAAYNHCYNYAGKGLLAGIINYHPYGLKCMCYAEQRGVQIGIINMGITTKGIKLGIINFLSNSTVTVGVINFETSTFLQIGLFNIQFKSKGIQLGLLNYRHNNIGIAKVLPIINFAIEKRNMPRPSTY